MSAVGRRMIERMVAVCLIRNLLDAGYAVSVHDGEEFVLQGSTQAKLIFDAMCTTDEDRLYVHAKNPRGAGHRVGHSGWVYLVYGNDGPDLINDYTTNLEPVMELVTRYCNALDTMDWKASVPGLWV